MLLSFSIPLFCFSIFCLWVCMGSTFIFSRWPKLMRFEVECVSIGPWSFVDFHIMTIASKFTELKFGFDPIHSTSNWKKKWTWRPATSKFRRSTHNILFHNTLIDVKLTCQNLDHISWMMIAFFPLSIPNEPCIVPGRCLEGFFKDYCNFLRSKFGYFWFFVFVCNFESLLRLFYGSYHHGW